MPEVRYTFKGDTAQIDAAVRQLRTGFKDLEVTSGKSLDGADKSSKLLAGTLGGVKTAAIAAGVAITAIGAAAGFVFSELRKVAKTQDEIAKLSQRFGVAVEDLSAFRLGAELAGTSLQSVATALRTGSKNALDASRGMGEAKRAFDELGISVKRTGGGLKSATEIMSDVADRFVKMGDGARKAALAQNIFGRSGAELIPLLNQGSAGLEAMKRKAQELGIVFDAEGAAKAEAFNDRLTELSFAFEGLRFKALTPLLPLVTDLAERMTDAASDSDALFDSVVHLGRSFIISAGAVTELLASVSVIPREFAKAQIGVAETLRDFAIAAAQAPVGPRRAFAGLALELTKFIEENKSVADGLGVFERANESLAESLAEFEKLVTIAGRGITDDLRPPVKDLTDDLRTLKTLADGIKVIPLPQIISQPRPRLLTPEERRQRAVDLAPPSGGDIGAGIPGVGAPEGSFAGPTQQDIIDAGIPGSDELRQQLVQPWLDVAAGQAEAFSGIEARSQTFLDILKSHADRSLTLGQQFQLAFVGGIGGAFVQFGAALTRGGGAAAKALAQSFAQIAATMGANMITQGIAEIITGHAPPPFGPRPDLIAHGTIMTVIGAGLAIGGGFASAALGGGGGAGAGGGFQGSSSQGGFFQSGPAPIDISSTAGQQETGGGVFAQLAQGVNTLAGMIEAAPAHAVLTRGNRQNRNIIPSNAFGEVPA